MGSCTSCTAQRAHDYTILLIGLDNAGKTTLSKSLVGELNPVIMPTVGFSKPTKLTVNGDNLIIYDLGGGKGIRGIWTTYFAEVHGVIFVVDSSEPDRLAESQAELKRSLEHPMLIGKPVLIFANKQDILSAATEFEVSKQMGLDDLAMCRHIVFPCIAKPSANANTVDERLHNGLHWLLQSMRTDYDRLNARIETQKVEWQEEEKNRRQEMLKKRIAENKRIKEEEEKKKMQQHQQDLTNIEVSTNKSAEAGDSGTNQPTAESSSHLKPEGDGKKEPNNCAPSAGAKVEGKEVEAV